MQKRVIKSFLCSPGSPKGFTLVELLISLAIVVIVVAGVFQLLANISSVYEMESSYMEKMTNLHIAVNLISSEIRSSGLEIEGFSYVPIEVNSGSSDVLTVRGFFSDPLYLSQDAPSGSSSIVLSDASSLEEGDVVLIGEREVKTVSSITGNTVSLNSTLSMSYPSGTPVRVFEEVTYYVRDGVLYRKTGGVSQPFLEGVVSMDVYPDLSNQTSYTITLNLEEGLSVSFTASRRVF